MLGYVSSFSLAYLLVIMNIMQLANQKIEKNRKIINDNESIFNFFSLFLTDKGFYVKNKNKCSSVPEKLAVVFSKSVLSKKKFTSDARC